MADRLTQLQDTINQVMQFFLFCCFNCLLSQFYLSTLY